MPEVHLFFFWPIIHDCSTYSGLLENTIFGYYISLHSFKIREEFGDFPDFVAWLTWLGYKL